jgi:hypothetical protein
VRYAPALLVRRSFSTLPRMNGLAQAQAAVCAKFGAERQVPSSGAKLGIALRSLHLRPLQALRHSPAYGTCGWYIWGGEMSEDPEFFSPLHVAHLDQYAPELVPYLALPPGWRVLLAPNHEDVWFEERVRDERG